MIELARHGNRPAVFVGGRCVTYAELDRLVAAAAIRLGATRRLVLVVGRNDLDTLVRYLGALAAGHVVLLADRAHEALIARYDPDVIVDNEIHEIRPGTRHRLHPELALLLSTSGSTGSPKLVRLSRGNLLANATAIASYLGIGADDRAITSLPISYCYGLSVVHSHLLAGAGLILTETSVLDDEFWRLFGDHAATSFAAVPYTFELLDQVGFDAMKLSSLRYVTQAGGKLAPNRVRRFAELGERRGWDLFVMYGATEATARMAYLPPEQARRRPDAIGRPIPGGSFTLEPLSETTEPDIGELVYHGPNVMLGYAESTDDLALGRTVDALRTGDIARLGADGLYEIVGRRDRFAKLYGLRIDLQRVESILNERGIRAYCVVAGDGLAVAVESDQDRSATAAAAAAAAGVPPVAVRVITVDEMPRLSSGKPDYAAIGRLAAIEPTPPAGRGLRGLYAEVLAVDIAAVGRASSFVSLGGDSLSYVAMSVRLERALGWLPRRWHQIPIQELEQLARQHHRFGRSLETSVALRAAAIVLIVGSHAGLFELWGGAHILLAVAGYNFARFCLPALPHTVRRHHLRSAIAWIVVPSIAWIAVALLLTDDYTVTNLLLLNKILGPQDSPTAGHLWFVEVLVYFLVILAVLLRIPAVDRWERLWPFGFALVFLAIAMTLRFGVTGPDVRYSPLVFWCFMLGWAAAKAESLRQRVAVTALLLVGVHGYFGNSHRELLVATGIAVLIWLPGLRCPAVVVGVAGVVADASLYTYLTHWQVFPLFGEHKLVAVVACVAVGVAIARAVAWARAVRLRPRAGSSRADGTDIVPESRPPAAR